MTQQKKNKNYIDFEFDAHHGFTKYINKQMLHEAGYDSYLTGVAFASFAKYFEANHFIKNYKAQKEASTVQSRPFKLGEDPATIMA